jgi:GxxExxY protein
VTWVSRAADDRTGHGAQACRILYSVGLRRTAKGREAAGTRRRNLPARAFFLEVRLACGYRADLVVNDCVLVEIKALESVAGIHERQLSTYLKLANMRVGLLLNFGMATMKEGILRRVNRFPGP